MRRIHFFSSLHTKFEIQIEGVTGLDHLLNIPHDKPVVFAADHLTDITVEAVTSIVSRYRDVGVAMQSTHLIIPVFGKFIQWATSGNVFPISTVEETKHQRQAKHYFKFKDYADMATAMQNRHIDIVIAAHKPVYDHMLPNKPGIGAVVLASLADTVVVPVAVDIRLTNEDLVGDIKGSVFRFITRKRPKATVHISPAIHIESVPKYQLQLIELLRDKKRVNTLSQQEKATAQRAFINIITQGETIMCNLAVLLPLYKQGIWEE